MIGAGIYYFTWVLGNKNLFGVFAWVVNIPLIIALVFTPTLVGKWKGMYKLNLRGYILAVIGRALVYEELLKRKASVYPVIKYGELPSEIYPAIQSIKGTAPKDIWIVQSYLQIILARCIPLLTLTEKSQVGSKDLIYQTVSYIFANFRKSFLLEDMAKDLGVSKYVLSRVFSKTFHRNFNQYLNDARLGYAKQRLENANDPITTICLDSGFESQRTFNRVFKEKYMVSPSEYRRKLLL